MKPFLFFLGSGASVPFGLPTMKQMVDEFEKTLYPSFPRTEYDYIKRSLLDTYGYVDLETIFSVIEVISMDVRLIDLEVVSTFILDRVGMHFKNEIFLEGEVRNARELLKKLKEFVRNRCQLEDSPELDNKISRLYGELFDAVCSKFNIGKVIQTGKPSFSYPKCPIYTTNYDLVLEKYFQGLAYINDLWKEENNMKVLEVEKRTEEGTVELIKLHGSLNWFRLENGTTVNLDSIKARYANQNVEGELMLYPIQQKDLYLYPWFNLFYRFKNDLIHTTNWIVLGYSFNDKFIRNMFREILKDTVHKLILIDPNAKEIATTHFGDNERVIPIVGKFEDDNIISNIKSELS